MEKSSSTLKPLITKLKPDKQKAMMHAAKKEYSLDQIKLLLVKENENRTKMDRKIIRDYLCSKVEFFSDLNNSKDVSKLEKLINVLNYESFSKGRTIISFGEDADKFYVLIEGRIGVYRPIHRLQMMKVKDYVKYIYSIKYKEMDLLKFERITEKNKLHSLDLQLLLDTFNENDTDTDTDKTKQELFLFIEEEEMLNEYPAIFPFGNIALIKRVKRNATIRTLEESHLVSINKEDYNKIVREIEEKKLETELKTFKIKYQLFTYWGLNQLLRLFNCFSRINLLKGDYLYRQNEDADCIYIVRSGMFDMYSLISFAWVNEYFEYIIDSKKSMVHFIQKHRNPLDEKELQRYYDVQMANIEPSPCKFDPYKVNKIITSNDNYESFEKMRQDYEEITNPHTFFKVLIKKIKTYDILGIEDALELKKRLCFVKCVSAHCELDKINLCSFFKLLSSYPEDKTLQSLKNIIACKKAHIFQQILNSAKHKTAELGRTFHFRYSNALKNENKPTEATRLLSMNLNNPQFFDNSLFSEEIAKKISLVKRNKQNTSKQPQRKVISINQSSSTHKIQSNLTTKDVSTSPKIFITSHQGFKRMNSPDHPFLNMKNTYSHFNKLAKSINKKDCENIQKFSKEAPYYGLRLTTSRLTTHFSPNRITTMRSILSPRPLKYNGLKSTNKTNHKLMNKSNKNDGTEMHPLIELSNHKKELFLSYSQIFNNEKLKSSPKRDLSVDI